MANPIVAANSLPSLSALFSNSPLSKQQPNGETFSFQRLLLDSLQQTSQLGHAAQNANMMKLQGGDITQVEIFDAAQKANMSLKMMVQIRNKLLEAFNEIKQLRM